MNPFSNKKVMNKYMRTGKLDMNLYREEKTIENNSKLYGIWKETENRPKFTIYIKDRYDRPVKITEIDDETIERIGINNVKLRISQFNHNAMALLEDLCRNPHNHQLQLRAIERLKQILRR